MVERTYRSQITAVGTPFISTPHMVGSLHTVRPPMTEARRSQIHGKLQSDDPQGVRDILRWGREKGQPPIWMGALVVGITFGGIALIVHGLGG